MSDIDPLIKREIQWMSLGTLENVDLAPEIIARVRRQRILRAITAVMSVVAIGVASIGIYELVRSNSIAQSVTSPDDSGSNAISRPEIIGLVSDYPIAWEPSVGDLGAISGAGGLGDTLGGLTAVGLKISWERCGKFQCPITWQLSFENRTKDLISTSPSLAIFSDHSPLVSDTRPTAVLPGGYAELVYTFKEFQYLLIPESQNEWQWNWYLSQPR
jgi:hypothetical protein